MTKNAPRDGQWLLETVSIRASLHLQHILKGLTVFNRLLTLWGREKGVGNLCNVQILQATTFSSHKVYPFTSTDEDLLVGLGNLRLYETGGKHTKPTLKGHNNTIFGKRDMGMLLTSILQG